MRGWEMLRMRIRMLLRRGRESRRLDAELRYHLDRQTAENIAAGMSAEDARRAALRAFGNPTLLREQSRESWSWNGVESLVRDLRYGLRTLLRTPGFSVIAALVMALGIGACFALFTVVRGVLLKPLPFKNPDQLLMIYEHGSGGDLQKPLFGVVSGAMYAEWRKHNHSFSDLALVGYNESNLSGGGEQLPEQLHSVSCTWNLLRTLGVHPALGRDFIASDDQPSASGTVLLSWSLWKRRFGGDPAILHQTIHLDGSPYTVIGVLPAWFAFPGTSTQLWTAVYHDNPPNELTNLGNHSFYVVGRLRDGMTPAQGIADLSLITKHVHDQHLDNPFVGMAANARPLLDDMVGDFKRPLLVLLAAACCVLLIACLNVANLLVARSAARRKELAIRSALGGGWLRLLQERLTEVFLLSSVGGAGGIALAVSALAWFVRVRRDMTRVASISIDSVVVAVAVALVVFCALFCSLISALSVRYTKALAALNETSRSTTSGRTRATLRRTLLAVEMALTVILLIGAALLSRSYQRLRETDMGCVTRNALTMTIDLSGNRYKDRPQRVNFYSALLTQVRALPGVTAAGFVRGVPGQGYMGDWGFTIAEHAPLPQGRMQSAISLWADPGYFHAIGITFLKGHTFDPNRRLDQATQAVVSASFARQYLPNEDPIGKHIQVDNRKYEIVGVVGDTRYQAAKPVQPVQYFPLYTGSYDYGTLVIRSTHDVEQFALPVQRIVQGLDRDLPVSDVLTMDQLLGKSTLDQSFNATLLMAFAVMSLLLAAAGLFGVLSYIVAQRTSEIGIRIALGAQREQVLRRVLLDGLQPALFGLVLGLAASTAVARLLRSMLYETQPLDPTVFATVTAILLLVAALACAAPAWRASRLDPMQALRTE